MEAVKLIPDWRKKLRKAWSVRMALLSGFFSAATGVAPYFQGMIDPLLFALLASFFAFGAVIARLLAQPDLKDE